ncbi:T9SS type A sorting domain-containing protein [Flavobacteriaceae bacterium]|nr:T9SS type A sorting domain-containing protein [Flavobacteriaceae bacterium]MDB4560462.1 T9SS type A sorting domain-containing protein [Flavobacteriaceae bacterium]
MRFILVLLLFVVFTFSSFAQQTINASITHDGIQRNYILYIPEIYDGNTAVPLILNFHGFGSNAAQQMFYGDFRDIADTEGFLLVHPEGTTFIGNQFWNVGFPGISSTIDDVGFTEALIDELATLYAIDLDRVYATGMSNGGFMSFLLACQLSEKIAAVASVTGSMTQDTFDDCNAQRPTPVLQIHGTEDDVVLYNGNNLSLPIPDVISYWVDYNNCETTPTTTTFPDIDPSDGSTIEHSVYEDGDNGITTEHMKVIGGGHTWPGSVINTGGTNQDIDASMEIWLFFSRFDINGPLSTDDFENNQVTIYPNPTQSKINLSLNYAKEVHYKLFSPLGKQLMTGTITSSNQEIDISHLPSNIYFLKVGNQFHKVLKSN